MRDVERIAELEADNQRLRDLYEEAFSIGHTAGFSSAWELAEERTAHLAHPLASHTAIGKFERDMHTILDTLNTAAMVVREVMAEHGIERGAS